MPDREYYRFRLAEGAHADPMLARIAELVRAKGVDPDRAIVADYFQDDVALMFGLLVSGDGQVFQFGYDYLRTDSMARALSEWEDLTHKWQTSIYASPIGRALAMLGGTA